MHPLENKEFFDLLVMVTVEILKIKIDLLNSSPRQSTSLWGQVCYRVYGYFQFERALGIQTWYKRNTLQYRENVEKHLESDKMEIEEPKTEQIEKKKVSNNKTIYFNQMETLQIMENYISESLIGRKSFLKGIVFE
jgi:hypothetical protein